MLCLLSRESSLLCGLTNVVDDQVYDHVVCTGARDFEVDRNTSPFAQQLVSGDESVEQLQTSTHSII